ncbi:MAG: hypothetical protein Q8N99_02645 [Nanoarchaeota archaeon]|nr:hypothetical protein [Nanoarchaeota archaeon]
MKTTWRIIVLIIALLSAALVIAPSFEKGVLIKSVEKNSTAYDQGLKPSMIITSINGEPVNNLADYTRLVGAVYPSENKTSIKIGIKDSEIILYDNEAPKITVFDIPKTKIKTGLDLSGGARALVKPEVALSRSEMEDLISVTSNRLNEFGISDVTVRTVSDLSGNNYMLIELAGATPADLSDLVSKQGKFEAKIGNDTVFIGGREDITYVARTGDQAGIYSCDSYQGQELCSFRFAITLSEKAAEKQAKITSNLSLDETDPEYLSKKLDLYLDDKLVDSLSISKDLKGRATTQISIQGAGKGTTRKEAYDDSIYNMKKLQTILITGSLPYKLEIVKIDTISPALGREFTSNILLLALIVFIVVSIALFVKYRRIKVTLAVIMTMFSEAFITLSIAALIKWNLDAPSIAGIIAGMGTGVNDQIVIIDEAVSDKQTSLKERIKSAFFVVFGAFFTIFAAMLPLFWAGAGLLKGFALTTLIGISIGVLITRPAFADIIKGIVKD